MIRPLVSKNRHEGDAESCGEAGWQNDAKRAVPATFWTVHRCYTTLPFLHGCYCAYFEETATIDGQHVNRPSAMFPHTRCR
jgi:hypothetical protein